MHKIGTDQIKSIAFTLSQNEKDIAEFVAKYEGVYTEFLRLCKIEKDDNSADKELK